MSTKVQGFARISARERILDLARRRFRQQQSLAKAVLPESIKQSHKWACVLLGLLALATTCLNGCAGFVNGANTSPTQSLAISNVQAAPTSTSAAQIVWTTNVPADSSVDYGPTSSYGTSTPVNSAMVTTHQVTISGLTAGTTYYYQVNSTDTKSNHGKSGPHSFSTNGFSISGTITPTAGGSGATVTLSGSSSASTKANGTGAFSFTGLPGGSYTLTPSNTGYTFTPPSQNLTISTSNVTGANFTATASNVAPSITTQPTNQTVTVGQTATFTVVAGGTTPLAYQWRQNGTAISGAASSSYTTPATTSSDNGAQFSVVVSNMVGNVTSNAAMLTVNSSPQPLQVTTNSLPGGQLLTPYSANLQATGGVLPYNWSVIGGQLPNGLSLSAANGTITGTPTTAGSSAFTVKVTDANLQTAQQSLSIAIGSASAGTVCAPTGSGVCYYVASTGSDSNSGTSSAPFLTIQHAASVVNPGDMVIVRDGTYSNSSLSGVGSKLVVMSRGGTASNPVVFVSEHKWGAKINGSNNTTATGFEFSANYIDVKDFECYGFSDTCMENYNGGSSSGGQYIDISGNNIHDVGRYCATTTTGRDGIFISNDNVTIEGNQIHDIGRYAPGENGCTNPAYYQNNDHGIYVDGAFTSANNVTIKNNIFYRNERGWSIQVYPAAVNNLRILNNTFLCANPYRNGHITLAASLTNSAIENNISWQPTTGFLQYDNTSGYSNLSVANNLTYQGTVGAEAAPGGVAYSGNLDNTNPLVVAAPGCTVDDPSVPNAYLQSGSPAIDAGLTLLDVPVDYAGTARPKGARFDIGAFEYIF